MCIRDRAYYVDYPPPQRTCPPSPPQIPGEGTGGGVNPEHRLRAMSKCVDARLRLNLTLSAIAHRVRRGWAADFPGEAVRTTERWVVGAARSAQVPRLAGPALVGKLRSAYFLVGVSERLNEFLVLLALHMGWDWRALLYKRCRPTELAVTKAALAAAYPDVVAKMERASRAMIEAHDWARREFEDRVARMPSWFPGLVREFEAELDAFQASARDDAHPFEWRVTKYVDGEWEIC